MKGTLKIEKATVNAILMKDSVFTKGQQDVTLIINGLESYNKQTRSGTYVTHFVDVHYSEHGGVYAAALQVQKGDKVDVDVTVRSWEQPNGKFGQNGKEKTDTRYALRAARITWCSPDRGAQQNRSEGSGGYGGGGGYQGGQQGGGGSYGQGYGSSGHNSYGGGQGGSQQSLDQGPPPQEEPGDDVLW